MLALGTSAPTAPRTHGSANFQHTIVGYMDANFGRILLGSGQKMSPEVAIDISGFEHGALA